jgi:XTP/dITP diphosphohydrolase
MIELIFATNNAHKAAEIQALVPPLLKVITLQEAGLYVDIPEPHATLELNAAEKSGTIHGMTGKNCFGEDTGLEVKALNGEPGVLSARYAGEGKDFEKNIEKLLRNLAGKENRKARFRTVISLVFNGNRYEFEGSCKGEIIKERRGSNGFGYDPVFVPEGSKRTFAEMTMEEKAVFSHRRKATDKLVLFLQKEVTHLNEAQTKTI